MFKRIRQINAQADAYLRENTRPILAVYVVVISFAFAFVIYNCG